MALTPQEIATGVLNSDRTVADVQSIRAANLPFGVYESLLQQARRNEERSANNITSSQIEAGYGQQSRPDVSGLANREAPSYAAPKRQNVRPQRTGVVGGGRLRTSGNGSAGVPNEQVRTMTTPDGNGIITDGNLDKEMANAQVSYDTRNLQVPDAATYAYGWRRNFDEAQRKSSNSVPNVSDQNGSESDADSSIVPALIMTGLLGTAGGSAAYALPKMLNAIEEDAKAATAKYNKDIGYGESMSAKDMKNAKARANYAGNKAWNNTSPEEKARINEEHLQNYKEKVKTWKESGLSWDEFNAREAAARARSATAASPMADVAPTTKAASPSAAAKFLNRALGLAALGLAGKGEYDALESVINKVYGGKNWEDYNSMNAAEEVVDGVLNPVTGMVGADDTARKTMALVRGLFDANNAEDYANMERWEKERKARKERMADKGFLDYINPVNALDTAGDMLVLAQDAVDYLVNDYDWGSNAMDSVLSAMNKKR